MVGYQEVMSDPSYTDQIVVMTYPLIGNYGVTDEDYESKNYSIGGFIVREYNDKPSNFRYTKTFSQVLEENNIPGICQIDTRKLTRIIRNEGSQKVLITDINTSLEEGLRRIHEHVTRHDQVQRVSSKKIWYSRTANPQYHVVAVDCGIKLNKSLFFLQIIGYNVIYGKCGNTFHRLTTKNAKHFLESEIHRQKCEAF